MEKLVAAAARAWVDDLRDALIASHGEETGLDVLHVWADAFPPAYRDDFDAAEALADFPLLEPLGPTRPLAARLTTGAGHLDLKLYGMGEQPSLSEVLPRLSNMGVVVDDEHPYELTPKGLDTRWMKWFRLRAPGGTMIDPAALRLFEEAFLAVVDGRAEDDGFNRLVLTAGLGVARGRAAARVRPLPAPDGHAVQPDVHRGRAERAHGDRAPARRAVRRAPRPVGRAVRPRGRTRAATATRPSAWPTRSAPTSTR